ncbi:hypothetical protein [Yersinia pseudotuberculosis]|uniref:hypothetical protein n=1 Tax=Yersinia pseudotuberculosis TaxID=633 RepID=UPI0005DD0848|nr:hypothetical protein [Yersinia pseudotuberculosis]CNL05322.1 Uncharacterised protein [Yersinia pseudotuberculosis]
MPPLDQHYTPPALARALVNKIITILQPTNSLLIEPAEGFGAFTKPLLEQNYRVRGFDIDPKLTTTIKQDFLKLDNPPHGIYIGNPPYGYKGGKAVLFFNKSAETASAICFILPRSFTKQSNQQQLNPYFHLVYSQPIDPVFSATSTRTLFQIWVKRNYRRITITAGQQSKPAISRCSAEKATHFLIRTGTNINFVLENPHTARSQPVIINDLRVLENIGRLNSYSRNTSSIIKSITCDDINNLMRSQPMNNKLLKMLNAPDYNFGLFLSDEETRKLISNLDVNDIKVLENTLHTFAIDVQDYQVKNAESLRQEKLDKIESLKKLLAANKDLGLEFSDLAALIGTTSEPTTKPKKPAKPAAGNNFTVEWLETDKKTNEITTKSYKIVNFNVKNNKIVNDPFFQAAMKKMDNNLFEFMATYSTDYQQYCNASYNGSSFYISNSRWNAESNRQFEKWVSEQSITLPTDIKEQRSMFKAAVLIK